MTINRNDDYDKLARILYPSIEASGNVYFGQTRKLTMDEILGKNDLNFESHIETFRLTDPEADYGFTYASYFCWKLGPFHSSFRLNPPSDGLFKIGRDLFSTTVHVINRFKDSTDYYIYYPNIYIYDEPLPENYIPEPGYDPHTVYGTLFAKYEITKNVTDSHIETTNSGNFKSYSNDFTCTFVELCSTDNFNPVERDDLNIGSRNFYISTEEGHDYLYIQLGTTNSSDYYDLPVDLLTLTAVNDSVTVGITKYGTIEQNLEYSIDNISWNTFTIGTTNVTINNHEFIKFRGNYGTPSSSNYIKFVFTGNGLVSASGDVRSLNMEYDGFNWTVRNILQYQHKFLFSSCSKLIKAPNIGYRHVAQYCYHSMFSGCSRLEIAPLLPAREIATGCYQGMFTDCTSLVRTPKLNAIDISEYGCYNDMFYGCTSLSEVYCYAASLNSNVTYWLTDTADVGVFHTTSASYFIHDNASEGIPPNWEVEYIEYREAIPGVYVKSATANDNYKYGVLVTSGSNSDDNGRGDITSKSTIYNMLNKAPDVPFDDYNKDGSFNQEIWGYKCFNSPVSFRNGIYGECASFTTWPYDEYAGLLSRKYFINGNDYLFGCNEFLGSMITCPNKEMHSEYNSIDMYKPDGVNTIKPVSSIYSTHANFKNDMYPAGDAGVLVTQSAITSSHIDDNQPCLYQLMLNANIQNTLPNKTAVVCANTRTFIASDGEGGYQDSSTTNSVIIGCKSYDKSAYVLTESVEINRTTGYSSKVEISAEEVNVLGTLFGNIPIIKNTHTINDSFTGPVIGGVYLMQIEVTANADKYIWPGMAIKCYKDMLLNYYWCLEKNIDENYHLYNVEGAYYFSLNAITNETGNPLIAGSDTLGMCFVVMSPASTSSTPSKFSSKAFLAVRIS